MKLAGLVLLAPIVCVLNQAPRAAAPPEGFEAYERSVAMVRAELSRHPGSADLSLVLAQVHLKASRFGEAVRAYEAGQRAHPTDLRFAAGLGRTYLAQDRPRPAIDALERALKGASAGSSSRSVRLPLAEAYARSGEFASAVEHLRAAAREEPPSAEVLLELGQTLDTESRRLRAQGDEEKGRRLATEARGRLEEAIRLRPDFADAHYALGRLLARAGERELAKKSLEAFRRLRKESGGVDAKQLAFGDAVLEAGTALDLAEALSSLGETESALDYAERALAILPRFQPAVLARARFLVEARPSVENYRRLAVAYFETGQLAECEKVLRAGLARHPGAGELLTGLRILEGARKGTP